MLFDTDLVIWLLRGNERAAAVVERAGERRASIVTLMELLQGARDRREAATIRSALSDFAFEVMPISEQIGALACVIIERHALSNGIQVADALVGATAVELGLTLCSGNSKHYRPIDGLQLEVFRP